MKIALKQPYKQFFGTLANQVRLEIIEILSLKSMSVGEIVSKLSYDQSTISHSLKRLEECGFVNVQPSGKERIYTLNTKTIKPLLTLMNTHMSTYCAHIVKGKKGESMSLKTFHIKDHCKSCKMLVEDILEDLGVLVSSLQVDEKNKIGVLVVDTKIPDTVIISAIEEEGDYKVIHNE